MEKLKVKGISSEEYPNGRIDSFRIPLIQGIHDNLIELFIELGIDKDEITEKLDIDFENKDLYPAGTSFFIYVSEKIKSHLIIQEEEILLEFDTLLKREKMLNFMKKYFELP